MAGASPYQESATTNGFLGRIRVRANSSRGFLCLYVSVHFDTEINSAPAHMFYRHEYKSTWSWYYDLLIPMIGVVGQL